MFIFKVFYRRLYGIGAISLAAVLLTVLFFHSFARPAHGYAYVGPKQYYLALGSSLAYGVQPNGDDNQGYAQDLYSYLTNHTPPYPTTTLIDYGCYGVDSAQFISYRTETGCPNANRWPKKYPLHNPYPAGDSQLDAALAFLASNAGNVSPVTLEIGGDDMTHGATGGFNDNTCTFDSSWPGRLRTLDSNLTTIILPKLIAALQNSQGQWTGDLILSNFYDIYNFTYPIPANDKVLEPACPSATFYFQQLNQHLAADAAKFGLAPPVDIWSAPAFNPSQICTNTWFCSSITGDTGDRHPNTVGYQQMTNTIIATTGY